MAKSERTLNGYEKDFIKNMNRLKNAGLDFEAGSRAALEGKFGGAADVILRGLRPEAMSEPRLFVEELSRTFGRGSLGILDPIVKYAKSDRFPPKNRAETAPEALARELGAPHGARSDQLRNLLHDQRIKDEQENYSDEAN